MLRPAVQLVLLRRSGEDSLDYLRHESDICRPVAKGGTRKPCPPPPPAEGGVPPLNIRKKKKKKGEKRKKEKKKKRRKKERREKIVIKENGFFLPNPKSFELDDAIKSGRLDHPN